MKKKYLRIVIILLGVVAYVLTKYSQEHPELAENYSKTVYQTVSEEVGYLPSKCSFSVSEILAVIFFTGLIVYFSYIIRKIIENKKTRGEAVKDGVTGLLALWSMVYILFLITGGFNYCRKPFISYTKYNENEYREEELVRLCQSLSHEMNRVRKQIDNKTADEVMSKEIFTAYAEKSVKSMKMLAKNYPELRRDIYAVPKPVKMSKLMSCAGIQGIFCPFTFETNINMDMPVFLMPAAMNHELTHQCGFMKEDEANFVAYLACKQSDDAMVHYSGLFLAFDHAITALEKMNEKKARQIKSSLSGNVKLDIAKRKRYWKSHEGIILYISKAVNDVYLKANHQKDGVNSYDNMVHILLSEQRGKENA